MEEPFQESVRYFRNLVQERADDRNESLRREVWKFVLRIKLG